MVLQVCDDNGACTPSTTTITITNVPPVVTNDRPAQTVHSGDAIAAVTVTATDLTSDQPFAGSSFWTKDGGAVETGLPTGFTLTAAACTPDDGATTCIWTWRAARSLRQPPIP